MLGKIQVSFHFANIDIALCPGEYATIANCAMNIAVNEDRVCGSADLPFLGIQFYLIADDK